VVDLFEGDVVRFSFESGLDCSIVVVTPDKGILLKDIVVLLEKSILSDNI
jgi:hypothetical protein